MHKFLNNQKIQHSIYVINQVDHLRFNRAALINIGYLLSRSTCDYIVMHDVDLLPLNPNLLYNYPEQGPYHLASPEYHPLYHYKGYIGGVLMMNNRDFEKCNGMSNLFWGWGREDDELYKRFKMNNFKVRRPAGLTTGYDTFKHIHDRRNRPRDFDRSDYKEKMKVVDGGRTGISNVEYTHLSTRDVTIDGHHVTFVNVQLHCGETEAKFCERPANQKPPPAIVVKNEEKMRLRRKQEA